MQTKQLNQAGERTQIELGSRVERIASDYTGGRKGRVFEIDAKKWPRALRVGRRAS